MGFWLGRLERVGCLSAASDVLRGHAPSPAPRQACNRVPLRGSPVRVRVLPRKHLAAPPAGPSPLCPLPRPVDSVPGRVGSRSSAFLPLRTAGARPGLVHRRRGPIQGTARPPCPEEAVTQRLGRVEAFIVRGVSSLARLVSIPMDHEERIIPSRKVFSG